MLVSVDICCKNRANNLGHKKNPAGLSVPRAACSASKCHNTLRKEKKMLR